MVSKDYSAAISETGYILKEDENNLEALLLRGRAYYYLADHDVAQRLTSNLFQSEGMFVSKTDKLSVSGITKKGFVLIQNTVSWRKHTSVWKNCSRKQKAWVLLQTSLVFL